MTEALHGQVAGVNVTATHCDYGRSVVLVDGKPITPADALRLAVLLIEAAEKAGALRAVVAFMASSENRA